MWQRVRIRALRITHVPQINYLGRRLLTAPRVFGAAPLERQSSILKTSRKDDFLKRSSPLISDNETVQDSFRKPSETTSLVESIQSLNAKSSAFDLLGIRALQKIVETPESELIWSNVATAWSHVPSLTNPPLVSKLGPQSQNELRDLTREAVSKLIRYTLHAQVPAESMVAILPAVSLYALTNKDKTIEKVIRKLYDDAVAESGSIADYIFRPGWKGSAVTAQVMAFARVGKFTNCIPTESVVRALVKKACDAKFAGIKPKGTSSFAWALATVGDPENEEDRKMMTRIIDHAVFQKLESFPPHSLSGMAWSVASLNVKHSLFANRLSRMLLTEKLQAYNGQDLANLIWSFSHVGPWNIQLAKAFESELMRRGFSTFSDQGLSTVLTSLVKLGLPETQPQSTARLFEMASREMMSGRIQTCRSHQSLASLAWAMGCAGVHDETLFNSIAESCLRLGFNKVHPQTLSNLMVGFVKAGVVHDRLLREVAAEVERGRLEEYSSQTISNILWVFARQGAQEWGMVRALVDEMRRRGFKEFIPKAIANIMWSLSKLCRYYDRDFLNRVTKEVTERGPTAGDGQYFSNLLGAFAIFNIQDKKLLSVLAEGAKLNLPNASFQSVVNMAWSFACLDQLQDPAVQEFFEMTLPGKTPLEYIEEVAVQVHQCKLAWVQAFPDRPLPNLLRDLVGDGKWVNAVVRSRNKDVGSSASHKDISQVLTMIGYNVQDEVVTANGLSTDIMVKLPSGEQLVIEVDGPYHFLSDDITPTGATLFKRRLLLAEGYRVESINVKLDWRWLRDLDDQKRFLKDLMLKVDKR